MQHIAIMSPKVGAVENILSGKKKIESRWYKHKVTPWNKVSVGEIVYFKKSGQPIVAKAIVHKVIQYDDLDSPKVEEIIEKYGTDICLEQPDYRTWFDKQRYCILIFLTSVEKVLPFHIDKNGFGSACAWLCVEDVEKIKICT